ncbi:MAG: hypothetical protein ABJO09_12000 [Hyphomicrobiales bacterium]
MVDLMSLGTCPLDGIWTSGHSGPGDKTGLTIERTTPNSLAQLSLFPKCEVKALTKLKKKGVKEFPLDGMSLLQGDVGILSLGAGRYLLESNKLDLCAKLHKAIPANIGSVTDLSSARTVFTISGSDAETVLLKGIAIDFAIEAFPIGKVAQTTAHHLNLTVVRDDAEQFRIFAFSTFARSAFEWLHTCALPHGVEKI